MQADKMFNEHVVVNDDMQFLPSQKHVQLSEMDIFVETLKYYLVCRLYDEKHDCSTAFQQEYFLMGSDIKITCINHENIMPMQLNLNSGNLFNMVIDSDRQKMVGELNSEKNRKRIQSMLDDVGRDINIGGDVKQDVHDMYKQLVI